MSEIRNKIITLSGEPASGKSTVVKVLKDKYESQGLNVHIISIGQMFREVATEEYLKMYPERVGANLADIQEDSSFAEMRKKIDKMLDKEIVAKKGEEINSKERPNDVYIIDSRLAWQNIPDSFAVRLTIDEKIAGLRVYKDKSRGAEDAYRNIEEAVKKTKQRKIAEINRYKQQYDVDLTNVENYNLIVDTSYSNTEELAEMIINSEKLHREGKHCAKNWASPAHFLPLQLRKTTGRPTNIGNTIESLADDIRKNGYHTTPDGVVEIIEKDGIKFLLEGNHRVFGALSAGRTLLPYVVTHRDDEFVDEKTSKLINDGNYIQYLCDYAEEIEYYGSQIGKIKELKDFDIDKLLALEKILGKALMLDGDER